MDLGLHGKVAMVAGASRGLGFSIAKSLAEEGVGVSIASREETAITAAAKKIQEEVGGNIVGFTADMRSPEDIQTWYQQTLQSFGGVDLLVTNTGGPPPGNAESFDDAAWLGTFELLFLSVVRLVRAVLPSMTEQNGGSIVMLTSSSVKEPIPNLALSNVIRPAVAALAKTLALELAPRRIRINHLIPGRIATDRVRELDEINSRRSGVYLEEHQRRVLATIPLGRYGRPEELARAAVFLLSDAAAYITGTTLQVDGGLIRSVL